MIKYLALLITFFCGFQCFSQEEKITSTHSHEVAIDVTQILENTIFQSGTNYYNPYSIMYRYHFDNWALRVRLGGSYDKYSSQTNDTLGRYDERSAIECQAGVEGKMNFRKRWQFIYGLDLFARQWSDAGKIEWSATVNRSDYQRTRRYGAAPFLGIRFKFNNRVSVATETSFAIYRYNFYSRYSHEPDSQYNNVSRSEGVESEYIPPTAIYFTFNF